MASIQQPTSRNCLALATCWRFGSEDDNDDDDEEETLKKGDEGSISVCLAPEDRDGGEPKSERTIEMHQLI